ncbi:MAG: superoxide dismutase [Verrucomicrobia bacterium]|nr:superoxide dismutase [Verrucomicrobiota bacterium]
MTTSRTASLALNRRQALKLAAAGSLALASTLDSSGASASTFALPALPYPHDALEPHIDIMTMQIHHGKHHQAFLNNLNKAFADHPSLAARSVEDWVKHLDQAPDAVRTVLRNSGGGHLNHTQFWTVMKRNGGGKVPDALARAIDRDLGGMEKFKEGFTNAATKVFGSGWAWLSMTPEKKLVIESTPNQDSPWMKNHAPLLGLDVWEHAYYLKYQNRRPEYIAAFYQVIHWEEVAARFARAMG